MDFTLKTYRHLLKSIIEAGFAFQRFDDFIINPLHKTVVLRHDVDLRPENSLVVAKIENSMGIAGSYYFRTVPQSFDKRIISEIAELGHEIGYHYENLTTCKGDFNRAIEDFKQNLELFRSIVQISTICMHGSPLSRWDSRLLWHQYNYRDFGITGEPYFDVDFTQVLYLTDTGRRWDGEKVSVRDKVDPSVLRTHPLNKSIHSTLDIIQAAKDAGLPDKIMITVHPQRWSDKPWPWMKELVMQYLKNMIKRILVMKKG